VEDQSVVIVYMDEESHFRQKQSWYGPWDRSVHARLIERLTGWGARAVVFDVVFDRADPRNAAADDALVEAVRKSGRVVLAAKLDVIVEQAGPRMRIESTIPSRPFDRLREAAAAWGFVEVTTNRVIREHFRGNTNSPSLSWRAAQLTLPPPPNPLERRWVNYYGPPGSIPAYSHHQVLEPASPLAPVFSNAVAIVGTLPATGFTGGTGTDDFATPFTWWSGTRAPGAEINATVYLNLKRRDWLRQLSALAEFFLFVATGAIFGFGLVQFRPAPAAWLAAGGIGLTVLAATLLVWHSQVWFAWGTVALVQAPVALGHALLFHTKRLSREKASLEMELATARASASARALPPRPPASEHPTIADGPAGAPPAVGALPHVPGLSSFFNSPGASPEMAARAAAAAAAASQPPPFTLLKRVGKGAYGEVWLARDIIGTYHAVKVVYRSSFEDSAPFEREFNGIRKFTPISRSHPGFVQILHVGRNDPAGYIYYIMEVGDDEASGQTIDPLNYSPKNLAKELRKRRRLPVGECLDLGVALADALHFLHAQKLIHRDIKPSNIIFVGAAPKFADIGLVTEVASTGRDVTFLGTKGYIAPEGPGTPAADVYSLGKVIYEAAMGLDLERYPDLPTTLVEQADSEELFDLNKIILKACEPDARYRYHSAAELHRELARLRARLKA
jgi:CHASE2 domain-containing sensor protein